MDNDSAQKAAVLIALALLGMAAAIVVPVVLAAGLCQTKPERRMREECL